MKSRHRFCKIGNRMNGRLRRIMATQRCGTPSCRWCHLPRWAGELGREQDGREGFDHAFDEIEEKADVILVSQVVTQKNIRLDNLTKLSDLLEAEGLRDKVILVVGGPRISHELDRPVATPDEARALLGIGRQR